MTAHDAPGPPSSQDEYDRASPTHTTLQWNAEDQTCPVDADGSTSASSQGAKGGGAPMQKRRRVTRACDECRRKKIKCDGKQPCTHCTVYSYDCTYDQPSNRRRNPAPQYIEALENRLQRAESLLKTVLPSVDLDDPNLSNVVIPPTVRPAPGRGEPSGSPGAPPRYVETEKDSLLESMIESTGSLDIDDQGHWDYTGGSSARAFLQRISHQLGDLLGELDRTAPPIRPRYSVYESPRSSDSPMESGLPNTADLPTKECGRQLCEMALDDALCLMRFMHRPSFFHMFDRIYDIPSDQWSNEENRYLPLMYSVMALGSLFAKNEKSRLQVDGYEIATDSGYKFFSAARQMIDITDCRDLPSLQTVVFMTTFLQSSARLATCYSYVGIALHAAIRMGLHRSVGNFNCIERECRRRLFWQIRKMDIYVGAMLGLPVMLSDEDVDQDLPVEIDDALIFPDKILPMPPGQLPLMAATNAHTRMMRILRKVIRYIYPIKGLEHLQGHTSHSYVISHGKIREIERDLQDWMENLAMGLRPGGEVTSELSRVQQLLRMAYGHVQMMTYRPFLHYISHSAQNGNVDKRSYACAAACVSVSRNVIHITTEMSRRGLLVGAYWFAMYTTFWAVIALVYFVVENPDGSTSQEILKDAREGREILASLAKRSMAADRSTAILNKLFSRLPQHIQRGRPTSSSAPSGIRKRQATSNPGYSSDRTRSSTLHHQSLHNPTDPNSNPHRAAAFPKQVPLSANTYKRASTSSIPFPQSMQTATTGAYPSPIGGVHTPPGSAERLSTSGGGPSPDSMRSPSTVYANPGASAYHLHPAVSDLSAMMFPSTDPFAYPNQPMMALENAGFGASSLSSPARDETPSTAGFNGVKMETLNGARIDVQDMFGPMPPYGQTSQPQQAMQMGHASPAGLLNAQDSWVTVQGHGQRGQSLITSADYDEFFGNGAMGMGMGMGMGIGMGMGMGMGGWLGESFM